MNKLYYVIEKQLDYYDDIGETNGWKYITVYKIIGGAAIVKLFELNVENTENSEEAIQDHIEEFEPNYIDVELKQL